MAWHRYSVHLYFDKARCFGQSERAVDKNFKIRIHKSQNGAFIFPFAWKVNVYIVHALLLSRFQPTAWIFNSSAIGFVAEEETLKRISNCASPISPCETPIVINWRDV